MLLPHSRVFDPQTVAMMGHVADAAWLNAAAVSLCLTTTRADSTTSWQGASWRQWPMASAILSGLSGKLLKRLMRDGPAA